METRQAPQTRHARAAGKLARGLGWFSLGLGLAELLMPRTLARLTGLKGQEELLQAYGVREIATGLGILLSRDPEPWIWARVGGDALDLATLGRQLHERNRHFDDTAVALAMVGGVTVVDAACAAALHRQKSEAQAAPMRDYRDRSGFPKPPEEMRGAAIKPLRPRAASGTPAPGDATQGRKQA